MCGQRRGRFPRERGVAVGSSTATAHGANVDAGDETVWNEANDLRGTGMRKPSVGVQGMSSTTSSTMQVDGKEKSENMKANDTKNDSKSKSQDTPNESESQKINRIGKKEVEKPLVNPNSTEEGIGMTLVRRRLVLQKLNRNQDWRRVLEIVGDVSLICTCFDGMGCRLLPRNAGDRELLIRMIEKCLKSSKET